MLINQTLEQNFNLSNLPHSVAGVLQSTAKQPHSLFFWVFFRSIFKDYLRFSFLPHFALG